MGIGSLIPFGLDTTSDQLVDVGSVKRGNACGCICPSCRTPLVARHGDEKEWHFAHRSQNVHSATRKECDYSFAVSIRMMIRQLSSDGLIFRTPRLERSLSAFSEYSFESEDFDYLVTDESIIKLEDVQVGVQFSGVSVDVLGLVQNVPFVVFVTYKDRSLPLDLKNPLVTKCGIVELNVNAMPSLFKKEKNGKYKEALRRYIEDGTGGKSWVYHPREQRLRETAIRNRQSWLQQQKEKSISSTHKRGLREAIDVIVPTIYKEHNSQLGRTTGKYVCVMCKNTWEGESRICKKCSTHLFTSEIE